MHTCVCRTLLESQRDGPDPSALNSPGGIRDDSVLGLAPPKPALNELPSPSSGRAPRTFFVHDSYSGCLVHVPALVSLLFY